MTPPFLIARQTQVQNTDLDDMLAAAKGDQEKPSADGKELKKSTGGQDPAGAGGWGDMIVSFFKGDQHVRGSRAERSAIIINTFDVSVLGALVCRRS